MKIGQINEGHCYIMTRAFQNIPAVSEDIANGSLALPYKEHGGRPFYCISKDTESGIVWLCPLSTKVEKFKDLQRQKTERKGYCIDFVFTKFNNRDNVINLSQAFPVLPSFVEKRFIPLAKENDGAYMRFYPVAFRSRQIVNRYWHTKEQNKAKGLKYTLTNADAYMKYMIANDFRQFCDLNPNEKRKVIETLYQTDTMKKYASKATEQEVVAYEREYQSLAQELNFWKENYYNPHTMEMRKETAYQFGTQRYSYFKGQKCHFIHCKSVADTLKAAAMLDSLSIPYRATINVHNTGELKILNINKNAFYDCVEKFKGRQVGKPKILGTLTEQDLKDRKCVRFDGTFDYKVAIALCSGLAQEHKAFACAFKRNQTASIYVLGRDADACQSIMSKTLDTFRNNLTITQDGEMHNKKRDFAYSAVR